MALPDLIQQFLDMRNQFQSLSPVPVPGPVGVAPQVQQIPTPATTGTLTIPWLRTQGAAPVPANAQQAALESSHAPLAPGKTWIDTLSPAEKWILQHESGFNPTAKNPTSTAFGIWQGLESTRKHYLGNDYQTTDPWKQLGAFRSYVKDRYQTPEKAQQFWEKNRWY